MKTFEINEKCKKQGVAYNLTHISVDYCPRVLNLVDLTYSAERYSSFD